jgi:serine/threonine protein kinase
MADLRHPFLVSLSYAFQSEKKLYYVMEYVPGGELFTRLLEEGVLPLNHVQVLFNGWFDRNPKNELNIREKIEWQILEKNRITFMCLRSNPLIRQMGVAT